MDICHIGGSKATRCKKSVPVSIVAKRKTLLVKVSALGLVTRPQSVVDAVSKFR